MRILPAILALGLATQSDNVTCHLERNGHIRIIPSNSAIIATWKPPNDDAYIKTQSNRIRTLVILHFPYVYAFGKRPENSVRKLRPIAGN